MLKFVAFVLVTYFVCYQIEIVTTTFRGRTIYNFYNVRLENEAEIRWREEETRRSRIFGFNRILRIFARNQQRIASLFDVCNMVEFEFRELCAKVVGDKKFTNNTRPYQMMDDNNSSAENGCRGYNIEFSAGRSSSSRTYARQCPTLPGLYLASGYSSVFVFRPLRTGRIKLTHYIQE